MLNALVEMLLHHISLRFDRIDSALDALNRKAAITMSLNQQESDAFAKLGNDLDAWKADLQAKLDAATATAASLQAGETADEGVIADLQTQLAAAQSAIDNTPDVVAAVNALDAKVAPAAPSVEPVPSGGTAPAADQAGSTAPSAAAPASADGQLADLTGHGETDAPADGSVGDATPPATSDTTTTF